MSDDPFFSLPKNSTWNACIGKQGDELHYLDGYIESAWELADAVIEKEMYGKRDTLVLPILYNARHAVELLLKFVANQLAECGAIPHGHRPDHDIQSHFDLLVGSKVGDEKLREGLAALERFVVSLARIDDDGQELRYHVTRSGEISLKGESLANIAIIRTSLKELSSVIDVLKNRMIDFVRERHSKTFTTRCSRRDLLEITKMLPAMTEWKTAVFGEAKEAIKVRFDISNTQFSKAVDVIKTSREMKAMLGGETDLLSLSDDKAVRVIEEWRKLHPPRIDGKGDAVINGEDITLEEIQEDIATKKDVLAALLEELSSDDIADLEALFYLGRDGYFPELYEEKVAHINRKQAVERNLKAQLMHIIDKTNLLICLREGAVKAGRTALAERLNDA